MKTLSELLRELRGKESLREVSERAGISHNYLSQLEKGVDPRTKKPIKPSPDTLKRLADAYNYDYDELMKIAGYIDDDQKDEEEFQTFINDPELKRWYKELPKSDEEDLRRLKKLWEIIKENIEKEKNKDKG